MTPSRAEPSSRTAAVVLAAGLGTRMRSRTPKILHQLCGRPMLAFVLDAWEEAAAEMDASGVSSAPPIVVYSPATESIRDVVGERGQLTLQDVPRGTGDAVRAALATLPEGVQEILVLSGDVPLVLGDQLVV
ncbi:MAG: NTP transferase domain-containing protein, partial [Gaiellales bacterium]